MQAVHTTLPRFKPMYGWTNRILRVDLSEGRIWAQESAPYLPEYIGARGIAHKILWDEYPEPVDAFHPQNPFMVFPGALTGTIAPYSGRTNVCAFSPQSHPYPWFTRASIGFDWGAKLKRAGYDGLVVTGASETPVHILIQDDEVSILPADDTASDGAAPSDALWGLDTIETQEVIQAAYGKAARTLTIGPAGERLSRIATVHTATSSVAGQGGFGAVMGSKKLKAITVCASQHGSGRVPVADGNRLRGLFKAVGQEVSRGRGSARRLEMINKRLKEEGGGRARLFACTASCPTPCHIQFDGVQGCHFDHKWSGAMVCVSGLFGGPFHPISAYDWSLGLRGGFELNMYANRLGLNHWDILIGMIPWLRACNRQGELDEVNGQTFDLNEVDFWVALLHAMAYREGTGDALAEGGWRAAYALNLRPDLMRRYYSGWGYAGHWDGHADLVNPIVYPFWIVSALHWAMDTRDPASSTHGYIQNVTYRGPFGRFANPDAPMTWDHMRGIGQRVYGRADTLDALSGYEGKAIPAAYHGVRAIMKDCLPTDDQVFPLIYSDNYEDRFSRISDPDGSGTIDGPDVDAAILRAGTGLDWDTPAFAHAAERVLNLERAITVRHWGRTRAMDERVIPSFEYDEDRVNPELGVRQRLDRDQFLPVMDEYYRLRGWDVETGWPTEERLERLGLGDVYGEMVAGATRARARLPELPPVEPVLDIHQDDPERIEGR